MDFLSELVRHIDNFCSDSSSRRAGYEQQWYRNLQLMAGQFSSSRDAVSRVRQKQKSYYRIAYTLRERLVAAIYGAYLRDDKTAEVTARGSRTADEIMSLAYDYLLETWCAVLRSRQGLLLKHLTAIQDCLDYGVCTGRFRGLANGDIYYDVISPDTLHLDWGAPPNRQDCIVINHYLTEIEFKDLLSQYEFINLDRVMPQSPDHSSLQAFRQKYVSTEFASTLGTDVNRYCIREVYLRMGTSVYQFYQTIDTGVLLTAPIHCGPDMPFIFGYVKNNPYTFVGESLGELVADAQETFNELLNDRLDNLALILRPKTLYRRDVNLFIKDLENAGAGAFIPTEDPANSVFQLTIPDVTQGAFAETQQTENIMSSLAGLVNLVTMPGTSGTAEGALDKYFATQAEPTELKISTFGESYWRSFHTLLLKTILRVTPDDALKYILFNLGHTQQRAFEITPAQLRQYSEFTTQIIMAHTSVASQQRGVQLLDLVNRASEANVGLANIMQVPGIDQGGMKFFDPTKMLEVALYHLGLRGSNAFKRGVEKPQPSPTGAQMAAPNSQPQAAQGIPQQASGMTPEQMAMVQQMQMMAQPTPEMMQQGAPPEQGV